MKNVSAVLLFSSIFVFATTHGEEPTEVMTLGLGDKSSQTITGKAWDSFTAEKYDEAIEYSKACINLYEKEAIGMQASLTEPADSSDREAVSSKWALNDVGTCYFILGQSLEAQGKDADAIVAYRALVKKFSFAQCWDPQGWFWKPADAAKKQIKTLEFEADDDDGAESKS